MSEYDLTFAGMHRKMRCPEALLTLGRVHDFQMWRHALPVQGFLKAYDSVRAKVMAVSDEVMGGQPHSWQIYVTGHSLGGALATLCSYELANRRWQSVRYVVCLAVRHDA